MVIPDTVLGTNKTLEKATKMEAVAASLIKKFVTKTVSCKYQRYSAYKSIPPLDILLFYLFYESVLVNIIWQNRKASFI